MSPGTTRSTKKVSTATPSSVGIMRISRLMTYFSMRAPLSAGSFVEPDAGEILVEIVARHDLPALQLLVVGDDAPVPDDRRDEGLVQQLRFELAHQLGALRLVGRAFLRLEQLVELAVLVAA